MLRDNMKRKGVYSWPWSPLASHDPFPRYGRRESFEVLEVQVLPDVTRMEGHAWAWSWYRA